VRLGVGGEGWEGASGRRSRSGGDTRQLLAHQGGRTSEEGEEGREADEGVELEVVEGGVVWRSAAVFLYALAEHGERP
jgi:hypothetical protein